MPKSTKRKGKPDRVVSGVDEERKRVKAALRAAVRREREIDRLAKQLNRAIVHSRAGLGDLVEWLTAAGLVDVRPELAAPAAGK